MNEFIAIGIVLTIFAIYTISSIIISFYLFDSGMPFILGLIITCLVGVFLLGELYIIGVIWGIIIGLIYIYALIKYIKEII